MGAKGRVKDERPAVFFRVDASESETLDALAERLRMGRSTVARHLVRWALEKVGGDPSKLFATKT